VSLTLDIHRAHSLTQARDAVARSLEARQDRLPDAPDAPIVLKPNLNSYMNGLTGNTTDLRVIAALLGVLRDLGFTNLTIAEGTNSGFYRNNIGVMDRLRVRDLAAHHGATVVDCNHAQGRPVAFGNGVMAMAAAVCLEASCLINIPKLKTHFEAGMSVCLKNLIGCLIGQENKKKTHLDLPGNIVRLNQAVVPHLHVVDAMIAMEGCGPSRGTPVRTDTLLVGDDPWLMDLACAVMTGIPPETVPPLAVAAQAGLLTDAHIAAVAAMPTDILPALKRARPSMAARIAHLSPLSGLLRRARESGPGTWLAGTRPVGAILYRTGIRQDRFSTEDADVRGLRVNGNCDGCGACREVCPMGADPAAGPGADGRPCISCLYCFMVCPKRAIEVDGSLGFIQEQLERYDALIRRRSR
jgi:uncharacterized protein (DUF362 family)/ferredoxin